MVITAWGLSVGVGWHAVVDATVWMMADLPLYARGGVWPPAAHRPRGLGSAGVYDVAIVGLGPAGRALASRCAAARMSVLAIDPDPDAPWKQTLCLWREQLPTWLSPEVVALSVAGPQLRSRTRHRIDLTYSLLDNERLREHLPLPADSVTVVRRRLDDRGVLALRDTARRVVDCRGAAGSGRAARRVPAQTAYGIVVSASDGAVALDGAKALLMDWTDDHGDRLDRRPSFFYALPLPGDRLLLEETCLAGRPAMPTQELADRLESRLRARGVARAVVDEPLAVEHVRIPLLPGRRRPLTGVDRFGTAAGHGQPTSGYSVAASLQAVTSAVNSIATGRALLPPRDRQATVLHRVGLRALLGAGPSTTVELFESFGALPDRHQLWYLTSGTPWHQVAYAMWRMWWSMPAASRPGLIAAVAAGAGPPVLPGPLRGHRTVR